MAPRPGSLGMNLAPNLSGMGVKGGMGLHSKMGAKLWHEAVKADPIMMNENLIEYIPADAKKDKNGAYSSSNEKCFIRFSAGTNKDYGAAAEDVTISFQDNISDDSLDGNAVKYTGEESTLNAKYATCSANDSARPLASFGFGIDKLDTDWWGLNANERKKLSMWYSETKGFHIRQAFCEVRSQNLTASPIGKSLAINPNTYFPDGDRQPVYDSTLASYQAAIKAASDTITTTDNHLTYTSILNLGDIAASDKYIKPIMIGGEAYYILYTSMEEIRRLRNPDIAGSVADYAINSQVPKEVKDIVPSARMVVDKLLLCTDDRTPTMSVAAGGAISFGYIKQGKTNTRAGVTGTDGATETLTYNVNMLWGVDALMTYERTAPMFKEQDDDYGREKGTLIHSCYGCELPIWDKDVPTDTSAQYEGGMLVLTSRESTIAK